MHVVYPTTKCQSPDLFPVPRRTSDSTTSFVKVGCRQCEVCAEEKLEAKRYKWKSRLMEMILHWQAKGDRVVFCTFTVHDDDYPDYEELKVRLSKMMHALRTWCSRRYGDSQKVKYWHVLEFGKKSGRIHAHSFFFVPKDVSWTQDVWPWLCAYWTQRFKAYILHSKLVTGSAMAVNYATKYGTKQTGHNRDRMLSSQFGWVTFMEEAKKRWLGLPEGSNGATSWLAVSVKKEEALKRAVKREDVATAVARVEGLNYEVVGRIRTDRPVLHPYAACWMKSHSDTVEFLECYSEKLNLEGCVQSVMEDSFVWVPATAKLLQRLRLRSAKRLQDVVRLLDLQVKSATQSTHPLPLSGRVSM